MSGEGRSTYTCDMTSGVVNVTRKPSRPGAGSQPIHIHFGRCGSDLLGDVDEPLTSAVNGEFFNLVGVDPATLVDGHRAINVHKSGA